MKVFFRQLKWQFIVLQKNNIINISFAVTLIYGGLLFFLKDLGHSDQVLIAMLLNDPTVIGYFFIALALYTEMKQNVLQAVFVTPVNLHHFLLSKCISISVIGSICAFALAFLVKGSSFHLLSFGLGCMSISLICASAGIFVFTFTDEFMKFALISVPVFLLLAVMPLLHYLGVLDFGFFQHLFPIQGSINLLRFAISDTPIDWAYSLSSVLIINGVFYAAAFFRFKKKLISL